MCGRLLDDEGRHQSALMYYPGVRLNVEKENLSRERRWSIDLPVYRLLAMVFVVAALAAEVVLSVRTHFVGMYGYGYRLGIACVEWGATAAALAYPLAYWMTWLGKKWKRSTVIAIGSVALVGLGLSAIWQGPKQLALVGFAARNRTADPAALIIAIGAGLLAVWQIANLFWAPRVLSTRLVITLLVFVNVYLFLAAW